MTAPVRDREDANGRVPVSVIIPAFNRAELVRRAVDSVLAQRTTPDEIIVVDECSTDATPEVAGSLGARVIRHEQNRGAAAARNTGLAEARNDWVALLDSDDEWLPNLLEVLWPMRDGRWTHSRRSARAST